MRRLLVSASILPVAGLLLSGVAGTVDRGSLDGPGRSPHCTAFRVVSLAELGSASVRVTFARGVARLERDHPDFDRLWHRLKASRDEGRTVLACTDPSADPAPLTTVLIGPRPQQAADPRPRSRCVVVADRLSPEGDCLVVTTEQVVLGLRNYASGMSWLPVNFISPLLEGNLFFWGDEESRRVHAEVVELLEDRRAHVPDELLVGLAHPALADALVAALAAPTTPEGRLRVQLALRAVRDELARPSDPVSVARSTTADSTSPAAGVVDRIAEAYYAVPRRERRAWAGVLSGIVVDRRGRGIANARVVVNKPASSRVIGEATTDGAGHFRIPSVPRRANVVTVTADGFVRWSVQGRVAAEGVTIPLDREVDDAFLSSLSAMEDREERLWGVMELVGARLFGLTLRDVHPHIGGLRPDLRLIAASPAFARADDRGSPADRARRLLAWWADPADADLTASWLAANDTLRPPPTALRSPFVDALCSLWADLHFGEEEIPVGERTAHGCYERRISRDGSRAHLTFWVRYAHWGYEMELVAVNQGEWELVLVGAGVIDHFEH